MVQINTFHVQLFSYVEKMKSTQDDKACWIIDAGLLQRLIK